MMTSMKWLIGGVTATFVVLVFVYIVTMQNTSFQSTADVEFLADNVSVGILRGEADEEGTIDIKHFNKNELIANLVAEVVSVQKSHGLTTEIDYLFYDKDGKATNEEEDIRSVQFRVQHVNKKGKVEGTAERRLTINQLDD